MRGFGELEQAIMDVVWAAGEPLPVREVRERLRPERELAYNTVQTVMAWQEWQQALTDEAPALTR